MSIYTVWTILLLFLRICTCAWANPFPKIIPMATLDNSFVWKHCQTSLKLSKFPYNFEITKLCQITQLNCLGLQSWILKLNLQPTKLIFKIFLHPTISTVFLRIISVETILFWILKLQQIQIVAAIFANSPT